MQKSHTGFRENNAKECNYKGVCICDSSQPATVLLMDMLEQSGLSTFVGKVNMDRNAPDYLVEETKKSTERNFKVD